MVQNKKVILRHVQWKKRYSFLEDSSEEEKEVKPVEASPEAPTIEDTPKTQDVTPPAKNKKRRKTIKPSMSWRLLELSKMYGQGHHRSSSKDSIK